MPENIDPKSLFAKLDMQDRARDFLARAVASGHTGQSYLFVGAPGAGKLDAAYAVAQAILCEREEVEGACGACDACVRVVRHTHPDVRYYAPESATGYLIAQTRALLDDVPLAPIRSTNKVYIIDRAEQLRANTANALLKTLEEPPLGVTFILLGTSTDVMLPTIVSRCQCVPFRAVSPTAAAEAVARATGLPMERCRAAVLRVVSPSLRARIARRYAAKRCALLMRCPMLTRPMCFRTLRTWLSWWFCPRKSAMSASRAW